VSEEERQKIAGLRHVVALEEAGEVVFEVGSGGAPFAREG
jgi:hypothetical protein